jgi:hypothetical protein
LNLEASLSLINMANVNQKQAVDGLHKTLLITTAFVIRFRASVDLGTRLGHKTPLLSLIYIV